VTYYDQAISIFEHLTAANAARHAYKLVDALEKKALALSLIGNEKDGRVATAKAKDARARFLVASERGGS